MRVRLNGFIRRQVEEGQQVYIVCPAVEQGETDDLKAAETWAETLQAAVFPDLRVALLHGKMTPRGQGGRHAPPSPPGKWTSWWPPR